MFCYVSNTFHSLFVCLNGHVQQKRKGVSHLQEFYFMLGASVGNTHYQVIPHICIRVQRKNLKYFCQQGFEISTSQCACSALLQKTIVHYNSFFLNCRKWSKICRTIMPCSAHCALFSIPIIIVWTFLKKILECLKKIKMIFWKDFFSNYLSKENCNTNMISQLIVITAFTRYMDLKSQANIC